MKVYLRSDEGHEEEMELVSWRSFTTIRHIVRDLEPQEKLVIPCEGHSSTAVRDVLCWARKLTPARRKAAWDLLHFLQADRDVVGEWAKDLDVASYQEELSPHVLEWLWSTDVSDLAFESDKIVTRAHRMVEELAGFSPSMIYLSTLIKKRCSQVACSESVYLSTLEHGDADGQYKTCPTTTGEIDAITLRTSTGLATGYHEILSLIKTMDTKYIPDNVITSSVEKIGKDKAIALMASYLNYGSQPIDAACYLVSVMRFWSELLVVCESHEFATLLKCCNRGNISGSLVIRLSSVAFGLATIFSEARKHLAVELGTGYLWLLAKHRAKIEKHVSESLDADVLAQLMEYSADIQSHLTEASQDKSSRDN